MTGRMIIRKTFYEILICHGELKTKMKSLEGEVSHQVQAWFTQGELDTAERKIYDQCDALQAQMSAYKLDLKCPQILILSFAETTIDKLVEDTFQK